DPGGAPRRARAGRCGPARRTRRCPRAGRAGGAAASGRGRRPPGAPTPRRPRRAARATAACCFLLSAWSWSTPSGGEETTARPVAGTGRAVDVIGRAGAGAPAAVAWSGAALRGADPRLGDADGLERLVVDLAGGVRPLEVVASLLEVDLVRHLGPLGEHRDPVVRSEEHTSE